MASPPSRMVMTNTNTNTNTERSRDSKRRRKKKVQHQQQQQQQQQQQEEQSKWKSQAQQQIYSSKLRQALARVPRRAKAVREAADRVLAATAKGRSRWSRAILTNRLKLKLKLTKEKRHRMRPSKKPRLTVYRLKGKSVQRKVRFLGRLVPGCRKQPLPVILQETIDYIPALQMQIRAMTNLVNLLAASSSSSSSSSSPQ